MKRYKGKALKCSICEEVVHNVGSDAVSVICPVCVSASLRSTIIDENHLITDKNKEDE